MNTHNNFVVWIISQVVVLQDYYVFEQFTQLIHSAGFFSNFHNFKYSNNLSSY